MRQLRNARASRMIEKAQLAEKLGLLQDRTKTFSGFVDEAGAELAELHSTSQAS